MIRGLCGGRAGDQGFSMFVGALMGVGRPGIGGLRAGISHRGGAGGVGGGGGHVVTNCEQPHGCK